MYSTSQLKTINGDLCVVRSVLRQRQPALNSQPVCRGSGVPTSSKMRTASSLSVKTWSWSSAHKSNPGSLASVHVLPRGNVIEQIQTKPSSQRQPALDAMHFSFILRIPISLWGKVQKCFRLYFCWLWTENTKVLCFPLCNHNFPSPL